MVAFPSEKSTVKIAGVEFSRCDVFEATRQASELLKLQQQQIAGMARGDGPEIAWATPIKRKDNAPRWVCWSYDSKTWYTARVPASKFKEVLNAILDEVSQ